jgi:hypothetical protein
MKAKYFLGYRLVTVLRFQSQEDIFYWTNEDPLNQSFLSIFDSQMSKPPLVIPFHPGSLDEEIFRKPEDCGLKRQASIIEWCLG